MLGSRYPYGATGLNTGCTSDAQISAKHNTQIHGPAIYTEIQTHTDITQPHPPDYPHHRNQDTDTRPTLPMFPQDW